MTLPSVTGKRIQRLRIANGLSQAEFAERTGIATGVVSMVENGRQVADDTMLKAAAKTLDCDPTYFTRQAGEMVSSRPWLRAYADASKRAVDRYLTDTPAAIEAIEMGGLKTIPEMLPTYDSDPNDDSAIEEFASHVRHAAKLDEGDVVGNTIRAAERLGCVVLPMDDELGRHMGMSLRVNAIPVIRVSRPTIDVDGNPLPSGDRQRFTVAHELGHLGLHSASPPPASAADAALIERQAHLFAGAFLTPADALLDDLDRIGSRVTLNTLTQLKERWGVAIKMLVVRMRQLDRIDDHQARSLYKQISARKWNKVEPAPVGHEEAIWFDRALIKAYAAHTPASRSPYEMAAAHTGLNAVYLDRWTDWSVIQRPLGETQSTGTVVPLKPRAVRPPRNRISGKAKIGVTQLVHRDR